MEPNTGTPRDYWNDTWRVVDTTNHMAKLVRFGAMGAALYLGNRQFAGGTSIAQVQSIAGQVQLATIASTAIKEVCEARDGSGEWGGVSWDKTPLKAIWDSGRLISLLAVATTWVQCQTNLLPKRWADFVENAIYVGYASGSICWFAWEATDKKSDTMTLASAGINLAYALSETVAFVEGDFIAARSAVGVTSAAWSLARDLRAWSGS
jgi:hypothetical protein